jgi:hypothetical protein
VTVVTWPGKVSWMTPPQLHMHVDPLASAGLPAINVVGWPGIHGADVAGMHGIGVSTPSAAAVAEATVGFARLMHIPKVGMLTMGLLSMIVAAGIPPIMTVGFSATSEAGATPKLHIIIPVDTAFGGTALPLP